jgi:hypothetical protein
MTMKTEHLITSRYSDCISGTISCFDRLIFQGTLNPVGHPQGMTSYLYYKKIRIFDYPKWSQQFTQQIREHIQGLAHAHNIPIEFVRKSSLRKEDIVAKKLHDKKSQTGLVCILSAMEACPTFQPWHDKKSGKTFLRHDSAKCLHYYLYFNDETFGLCYIRVPTWLPFRLQVYSNGHNWLASNMRDAGIQFTQADNLFTAISDFDAAQSLGDSFSPEQLHVFLDRYAKLCCPFFQQFNATYHWSIMQAEYATDIVFASDEKLKPLYEHISRSAVIAVKAENIATFLGRKLDPRYQDDVGNHFNTRIEGTRIRHSMGPASIKAYDKFKRALRIETATNDVSFFKHYRDVQQADGTIVNKIATMRKSIYSLQDLSAIMRAANMRYLEFLSALDDPTDGAPKLEKLSSTITENNHPYKGFNFFDVNDLTLLRIIARGEYAIIGFKNSNIRHHLSINSTTKVSRIIKRLRVHGLIKKVSRSYKYYLTALGKKVVALGLNLREFFVTPSLSLCQY